MILQTKQLTVRIDSKMICRDLDLAVNPGEVWGILGPNGSGKTTLLHALAGLHPISSGEIFLQKKILTSLQPKSIAQSLGILFQDFNAVFPQTVWDYCLAVRFPHLAYFKKEEEHDHHIANQALQQMELTHASQKLITQLSGGEKRRLAIAALLTQTPSIYLLDEPTNHLDVRYQIQSLQHFRHLAKKNNAAIIMTLHDVNLAQQFCDRILLLFGDGTHSQGLTHETLTKEHLQRLYQHPMQSIAHDSTCFWYPIPIAYT